MATAIHGNNHPHGNSHLWQHPLEEQIEHHTFTPHEGISDMLGIFAMWAENMEPVVRGYVVCAVGCGVWWEGTR